MKSKRPTVASLRAELARLKRLVVSLDAAVAKHIRETAVEVRR